MVWKPLLLRLELNEGKGNDQGEKGGEEKGQLTCTSLTNTESGRERVQDEI